MMTETHKIGIDLGGTKIAAILLDSTGNVKTEKRFVSPHGDYVKTIDEIRNIVADLEYGLPRTASVGIGIPGSISPASGLLQNANSTWLNGRPFHRDLSHALEREVRIENDANCFALSEALNGSGRQSRLVFGVIIGTGCGGGLVFDSKLISGPNAIGGEWGHNPLPWPTPEELGTCQCWCGKMDCLECWISGPGMSADHYRFNNENLEAHIIAARADHGDASAQASIERYLSRLARGLAVVTNFIDPDVIVLGGGLSNIEVIYSRLPELMRPFIFADHFNTPILRPEFGDASGVRGAAHLWP